MNKILNLAIRLFAICAVAALVLAVTNNATAPVIAEREAEELAESLKVASPEAEEFEELSEEQKEKIAAANENVGTAYLAKKGGETVGYVFYAIGKGGYDGDIEFILGLDKEGTITGYQVMKSSETPGLGSRVAEDPFVSSVVGKKTDQPVVAVDNPTGDYEIQAISQSTVSVNAILNGINGAVAAIQEMPQ
jgi:electron transport complex protein RnfG